MSRFELRVTALLAAVFGFRMLGLFLVLPVFSVFAATLPGGHSLQWVGLAMGAFALTQALLQMPLGFASDRWGRKPVIIGGLVVYALGSVMAAWAPTIEWMVAARCVQGMGAISAAITALAADFTGEQHRAKAMAIIGVSIGLVFALSLVAAPALYAWVGMDGIFLVIAALAIAAIFVTWRLVPPQPAVPPVTSAAAWPWTAVLGNPQLMQLNFGIFSKHMVQMGLFLAIPRLLVEQHGLALSDHWLLYLPVVLVSFALAGFAIVRAERNKKLKPLFVASIAVIVLSQAGLFFANAHFLVLAFMLLVFFVAFNILEASTPALVSRIAPSHARGFALGVFHTCQSLGAGLGAVAAGWLAARAGLGSVFAGGAVFCVVWGLWALRLRVPPILERREYAIAPDVDIDQVGEEIAKLPGVGEVSVERDRRIAYLKVNIERWEEHRLRRLIGGEV